MKAWDTTRNESQGMVLLLGLLTIVVLIVPVLYAVQVGWPFAALLGLGLLASAWFVPVSRSARALRFIVAGGAVCLVGAVFQLVT